MAALTARVLRPSVGLALVAGLIASRTASGQTDGKLLTPPARQSPTATSTAPPANRPPPLLPGTGSQQGDLRSMGVTRSGDRATTGGDRATTAPTYLADARAGLKVSKGQGVLPNDHGQIWREYDISPYTLRVRDVAKPEQAIVDWILRETGTEVWFAEPLGILNASSTTLRVYHTADMHERVRSIVERFVGGDAEAHALGVRLMTVGSPNWRVRALSLLRPVDVKSPGVEAWLLSRENGAALYEQLKSRADFREHSSPHVEIANGQSQTLARTQPRQYTRGIQLKREFPFYDTIPGKIDEGYSLQISPLMSLDGQTIEAAITCSVDQVEKLVPLAIDVPVGGQTQRVQVQVPQVASWRLAERFRWPASELLLLSCGVVASPAPGATGMLSVLAPLGVTSGSRADALLLIEHKQPALSGAAPPQVAAPTTPVIPPIAKPAPASATIGTPTGSATSVSRGRY
jgi:hypothetical protein